MISVEGKTRIAATRELSDKIRRVRLQKARLAGVSAIVCLLASCQEPERSGPLPRQGPGASVLSEETFDTCAAQFADALRRWPVVDRAEAPVLLASPRWRNESSYGVRDGSALTLRMAKAINLRTGAKVRIAPPGALGCQYASELVLLSGTDIRRQPVLVLSWRVVRPGTEALLLEEAVTVRQVGTSTQPSLFARAAPTRQIGLAPGQGSAQRAYHDVLFEHGRIRLEAGLAQGRVTILGQRTWRDEHGRLCVELRLLSRPDATTVDVLAYRGGADATDHGPASTLRQVLAASKPTVVVVVLPKAARSYDLVLHAAGER